MARLLLRLLLIVSLVMNGVAAPWAMANMRHADASAGHMHATAGEPARAEHAGHTSHVGHAMPAEAPPLEDRGTCCDGFGCDCGCVLPPMLARMAPGLPAVVWTAAPHTEPATRFAGRSSMPPFRPPAA